MIDENPPSVTGEMFQKGVLLIIMKGCHPFTYIQSVRFLQQKTLGVVYGFETSLLFKNALVKSGVLMYFSLYLLLIYINKASMRKCNCLFSFHGSLDVD